MSSTGSTKRSQSSRAARPDCGVFEPDTFWGHTLTGPTTTTEPDSFDTRVARALRFMRNMFFTPEEHEAMAEAVVRLVSQKQESDQSPNTHPRCR